MDTELLLRWLARLGGIAGAALCLYYLHDDNKRGLPAHRTTQAAMALFLAAIAFSFMV